MNKSGLGYALAIALFSGAIVGIATGFTFNLSELSSRFSTSQKLATASKGQRSTQPATGQPPLPTHPAKERIASKMMVSVPAPEPEPQVSTVVEKQATEDYRRAIELANQAVEVYQQAQQAQTTGDIATSLNLTRQERFLWRGALKQLRAIPRRSALFKRAIAKQTQYQQLLETAESKLNSTDSRFLADIIQAAGIEPNMAHITLCQIGSSSGEVVTQPMKKGGLSSELCRDHQGDQLMASAASLIKVPIAIALLHKVAAENIDLQSPIFIDPGNFTEDAAGAKIEVGQAYPLSSVMAHMIDQSNNVATNQLIDYVGRDYIEKTLTKMGYSHTYAGHKLAGDATIPVDSGSLSNQSTSHDITAMMVDIYSQKNVEQKELVTALRAQSDRDLGYIALQNMGPAVEWLGEKTGQNNRVLASTLVAKIGDERYALTVALNHSGDSHAIRQIIHAVAEHVLITGPLVSRAER